MKKLLITLQTGLIVLLALVLTANPIYAHANLVHSDPAPNSILPSAPKQVTLLFSEDLEQKFTRAAVYDIASKEVDTGFQFDSVDRKMMIVTLPELPKGVYTVVWKAISAVDWHSTGGSFSFGVGDVLISTTQSQSSANLSLSWPAPSEVIVRWLNLLAEILFIGGALFAFFVWFPVSSELVSIGAREGLNHKVLIGTNRVFSASMLLALIATAANLLLEAFAVSASSSLDRLGSSLLTILTSTWIGMDAVYRIAIISVALVVTAKPWFVESRSRMIWIIAVGGALLLTTSLTSHNAARPALPYVNVISDWIHLVAVSAWVGGLLHFVLTITLLKQQGIDIGLTEKLVSGLIRRFSIVAVTSLGVVGVTGLYAAWLEIGSLTALFSTSYGLLLLTKLSLIAPMLVLGAFHQFAVHDRLVRRLSRTSVHSQTQRILRGFNFSLRTEAAIGLVVLITVATLSASIPAYQSVMGGQSSQTQSQPRLLSESSVTNRVNAQEGINFTFTVYPFRVGINQFNIQLTNSAGQSLSDVQAMTARFTFLDRDIGPTTANAEKKSANQYSFQGSYFSFPGRWQIDVLAKRTQAYDAIARFEALVPSLDLRIVELPLPAKSSSPYGVAVDNAGSIWFTESGTGSIARFDPRTDSLKEFTLPRRGSSPLLLTIGKDEVWMTETQYNLIVQFDPATGAFKEYQVPTRGSVPGAIITDGNGDVWFTEEVAGQIGHLTLATGSVTEVRIPTSDSIPIGIAVGKEGSIWFTESKPGKIGRLEPSTGSIVEFVPSNSSLSGPTVIVTGPDGAVWFAEHAGNRVTRFDTGKKVFQSYAIPNNDAFPYGLGFSRTGRLWVVEHIGNSIGTLNVTTGSYESFPIPTPNSDAQILAVDSVGNVWFTMPAASKVGVLTQNTSEFQIQSNPGAQLFTNLTLALIGVTIIGTILALALGQKRMRNANRSSRNKG